MARKANPALIGAFVVGALALAVAGLVLFGGGRFFRETRTMVAYFEGSVKGVAIGAPVTFQGVKVGSVTDVRVIIDPKTQTLSTPVFFELEADRIHDTTGAPIMFQKGLEGLKQLIQRGLRAQLELQSVVTGQVGIALGFHPGTPESRAPSPGELEGVLPHAAIRVGGPDYVEMPTVPSDLEKLTRTIQELPIAETMTAVKETVQGIRDLVQAPETRATLRSLQATVEEARRTLATTEKLLRTVDAQVDPLMTRVTATLEAARSALAEAQTTIARLGPTVEGAVKEYQSLARNLDDRLGRLTARLEQTLAGVNDTLGEDSAVRYNAVVALEELGEAVQSIRALADYLERNPNALVFGK